jgi:uncharacterized protein YcbX
MTRAEARVVRLARFPVKGCAAEPLTEAQVGVAGLRNDRWLAVVVDDRIVTQREHPVLARVQPVLDDATAELTLSWPGGAPGQEPVQGVVDTDGPLHPARIFDEPVDVVDQSAGFAAWVTRVLGRPARLVAAPATTRRTSPGEVEGLTVLSDEATVSLHSLASLGRLNEALAARGHPPVPADRFRANIVVDGCPAHAEDEARRVDIGGTQMRFARLDPRCAVVTVDQAAGERSGPEPLRTLADYRRTASGGVVFGTYLAVTRAGTVHVGDPVVMAP